MIPLLLSNLWRTATVTLLGVVLALLIQIHGLPVIGGGLLAKLDRMTELRRIEADNHRKTKAYFAQAMADALRNEKLRLARVRAEQERINHDREASANERLAALRARYDQLRGQGGKATGGQGGAEPVPGLPTPAFGADAAASEDGLSLAERYACSATAIQLDELISWVEAQTAVDPNEVSQ
jgi:hypothetical protein